MLITKPCPEWAVLLTRRITAAKHELTRTIVLGVHVQQMGDGGAPMSRAGRFRNTQVLNNQCPPARGPSTGSFRRRDFAFL